MPCRRFADLPSKGELGPSNGRMSRAALYAEARGRLPLETSRKSFETWVSLGFLTIAYVALTALGSVLVLTIDLPPLVKALLTGTVLINLVIGVTAVRAMLRSH